MRPAFILLAALLIAADPPATRDQLNAARPLPAA